VLYLIASFLASIILFIWLKERVLYVIFPWAYIQNFVLAWMYTNGFATKDLCQALLILKEFLLLWLFLLFLPQLRRCGHGTWPLPLRILGFFTLWCTLRYLAAVVFQGESLTANLWNLRVITFPFQILTVATGVAFARPMFAQRFIRQMAYLTAGVALVGILTFLLPGINFWRDHVNIATYNAEVKGESASGSIIQQQLNGEDTQEQEEGVPGNARGREEFSFISHFRAIGTVCDAVGFGHLVAFPILLFSFYVRRNWKTRLMLLAAAVALFFTFTRSAWIFVFVGCVFVLLRRKRYRLILGTLGVALMALVIWTPLADLYSGSLALLSWSNPQEDHAEGLVWLYKQGLWETKNILGQGMTASIPEGGYGMLLIRYGMPALLGIIWFMFSLHYSLRRSSYGDRSLFLVAQAVPLAMLVVMNTSYYPFSFIPYLLVWFVVGTCLAFTYMQPAEGQ
jgi:hypothetical protein